MQRKNRETESRKTWLIWSISLIKRRICDVLKGAVEQKKRQEKVVLRNFQWHLEVKESAEKKFEVIAEKFGSCHKATTQVLKVNKVES